MRKYTVNYGDTEITFKLERKDVKHVNLNICPDLTVTVSANRDVPLDTIKNFVRSKGLWISKSCNYFERFQPVVRSKKEYISGESFKYLGRQYRLKVQESKKETIKYSQGFIYLYIQDANNFKKKKRLFQHWLYEKTKFHFQDSLDRMYGIIERYNIPKPAVEIRQMKLRWGSCNREDHVIVLNSELIKAPKYCIDYVVLHELVHFKYKNHDESFYTFLTSFMPDWKMRKQILDEEVIRDL